MEMRLATLQEQQNNNSLIKGKDNLSLLLSLLFVQCITEGLPLRFLHCKGNPK
jgi:hypothetical protein